MYRVVWLTDSPTPDHMGLLFDENMPDDLIKTRIRFTIKKKPYIKKWDEWSDAKGMDKQLKQALIGTVSERIIPMNDVLAIENIATGKIIYQRDTGKAD
jgi:hypothetical protein